MLKKHNSKYKVIRFIVFIYICLFCNYTHAQQKEYVLIDVDTKKQYIKKDSVEAVQFLDSLVQSNYFFTKLHQVEKNGNKTEIYFNKGNNFNEAYIKISDSISLELKTEREFYTKNLDSIKNQINKKYIEKGFSFSRLKTKYVGLKNQIPIVELSVNKNQKRKINSFVIRGYERIPKRFIKNLEKEYRDKSYNEKNLLSINSSLQSHPFVTLERPPQTLFTKDSTHIYLFLQKKNVNSFDGILGFGNDKTEKFTFNGSLHLNFQNIFNSFENISLFWQRNPDKGQTFDLKTDIPYLLNSNVGTNINLNIYRQDSTFANVKILPAVYYNLSNRQKIGLRGTFETSTVLDSLYVQGKDYSKKGIGVWYDYTEPTEVELFLHRMKIRAEADLISTNYSKEDITASQMRYFIMAERNFSLSGNHWLNLKGESALLNSKNEFTANELLRFGGWNSMRGFNENALFADFYYYGNAEYRYLAGNQAFFDFFIQYGQLNSKALNLKPKLYSFGLGFNFFLPIGLMSFQVSNGNEFGNQIKFNDTKIHWGILTRF